MPLPDGLSTVVGCSCLSYTTDRHPILRLIRTACKPIATPSPTRGGLLFARRTLDGKLAHDSRSFFFPDCAVSSVRVPRTSEDSHAVGQHREGLSWPPCMFLFSKWVCSMIGEVWYVTAPACPSRFLRGPPHREHAQAEGVAMAEFVGRLRSQESGGPEGRGGGGRGAQRGQLHMPATD